MCVYMCVMFSLTAVSMLIADFVMHVPRRHQSRTALLLQMKLFTAQDSKLVEVCLSLGNGYHKCSEFQAWETPVYKHLQREIRVKDLKIFLSECSCFSQYMQFTENNCFGLMIWNSAFSFLSLETAKYTNSGKGQWYWIRLHWAMMEFYSSIILDEFLDHIGIFTFW